jgi:hypothetical protein
MSAQGGMTQIWQYSISGGVPTRSLIVALVVGTIVNLINQGDALVAGHPPEIAKLLATYVVSYFVGTYGAVSYRLHADRMARQIGTDRIDSNEKEKELT